MNTNYARWRKSNLLAIGLLLALQPALGAANAQVEPKPQAEVRTYTFEMSNKPWSQVFAWLADQTSSQFIAQTTPTGTFSFVSASQRKYSLPQIVDILNEVLVAKGHLLVRGENSFVLLPADQPVPIELVPRVRVSDLSARGNSELVSVVLALKTVKASEIATDIKKLLSPFGQIAVLKQPNQLVVQDLTGNLRKVIETINGVENADTLVQTKKPHKGVDVRPPQSAAPLLRTYTVPGGNASALAKLLQEVHKNSVNFRITALGPNSILVYAPPAEQIELARHLTDGARPNTELISLNVLDANRVAETLRQMFGDVRAGGPYVEAETDRNALIVRGTAAQLLDVKEVLTALGEGAGQKGGVRMLNLQTGSAATLAEALQKLLADMRPKLAVRVVLPGVAAGAQPKTGVEKKASGKEETGLTITAMGNRIMVASDDAQALALTAELFRLLTATPGDPDFEVVRLKYALARNVAHVLDEAFNGSGGKGGGPAMPRSERVRIVADPATNSLLIKASPLDTLTIRRLLTSALDIEGAGDAPDQGLRQKRAPSKKGAD